MSESDGMDDVLDAGLRQSLMIASRIAETLARRRQEHQRQQQHLDSQAAHEAQARLSAERATAHAALAPVENQWWDKAQPADIATAYAVAEAWKDHDPTALEASGKIRQEVLTRYGIDTRDIGADAAYLESIVHAMNDGKTQAEALAASGEQARKAAAEHDKAMQLLAAARAEELRAQAAKLAPEMERHHVPVEYLANPELTQALQRAHNAKTPKALDIADADIKERLFLIGKDGINGPDLDQLRTETAANINGTTEAHFKDPAFVTAAKNLHEAKLLAESGFTGDQWSTQEQRYERAEKELFARIEDLGRDIESRVTGKDDSSRIKDQALKAETVSADGYGSAEHHQKFAESLTTTGATEPQIRGRLAAARSEGTHPNAAVTLAKAAKARRSSRGTAAGAERSKNGPSR
ncbi:hypothetical protein [Paenarthrobacter aromaticivorans]|uniref:Uncharacterized protein n=1 Tax=Paenarthrobacter aromaticivorans TaxID=2849150 RepID=A0ABS6I7X1_9MICC|nr:hypothetical protein [Paenarthrobacter sp. MMS21-TAE1-1]MBU8867823.1 hypothetical protein [Paenarthrobacter sp. MMS21-TAE1-1]